MKCLILSEFAQVRKASAALAEFAQATQLDEELRGIVELILVEALNNVIEHAYQGKDNHPIEIEFKQTDKEVLITIEDQGIAVPVAVTQRHQENNTLPITMPNEAALPEGGWGLGLIEALADRIEFSTQEGGNLLVLSKRIA